KGGEAVGFLVADVGDVADGGRPLGEAGDGGEGHDSIADGVHVHVDTVERPAVDRDARRAAFDAAAHVGQNIDEAHITLQAVFGDVEDRDAAAGDRCRSEEVA